MDRSLGEKSKSNIMVRSIVGLSREKGGDKPISENRLIKNERKSERSRLKNFRGPMNSVEKSREVRGLSIPCKREVFPY